MLQRHFLGGAIEGLPLDDPELKSVLAKLRFNPALEAGKPIEGIAPVKLSSLSQL